MMIGSVYGRLQGLYSVNQDRVPGTPPPLAALGCWPSEDQADHLAYTPRAVTGLFTPELT